MESVHNGARRVSLYCRKWHFMLALFQWSVIRFKQSACVMVLLAVVNGQLLQLDLVVNG